jgi:DNA-binding PadR family transcriptional regulator
MILKVLSQHGRMYGYEIAQTVKYLSGDEIIVNEGSLYPILHKMEEEGIVRAERINIGNRTRRYYTLTDSGKSKVEVKIEEFERFVQVVRKVLYPAGA